ncbi:anti-adapter protein IraP [[Erwinia] mediterraneensis]|uniref:anti-adapter protein IraP n=1 Tax=[Erwinia] mediterraneensis TaxID=2161819 RepID=UPI0010307D66|nr:anti-adapter protein IraP [[Erwinia] mediterraneensis]
MKNLIAELLLKLAEKEEESKELVAQVEALEIVVTAMLRKLDPDYQQSVANSIENALQTVPEDAINSNDSLLLRNYIDKLLKHPRS